MAGDLNNTSSWWWSLAQTVVWIVWRIELPPREAEQLANSPEKTSEIEWALNKLTREFCKVVLGVPDGMPIDKFRTRCGSRYVDLLTLVSRPLPAEPSRYSPSLLCSPGIRSY